MGFISSLIGANNTYQAPTVNTGNSQQLVDNGLGQQGSFAAASGNNNAFAMQNALAGQLAQGAAGQGPNPALAQLQQTTGQNIASQAALQGSQRGVGQNAGLLARQAAQQGGQLNQQAVGQGATLAAQQQMAYQQSLGQLLGQQVGQQQTALGQFQQGAQANNGTLYGYNQNSQNVNAGVAQQNAKTNATIAGGALSGAAAALPLLAHGGEMPQPTGEAADSLITPAHLAEYFCGGGEAYSDGTGPVVPGQAQMAGDSKRNDTVPAMLSPGEIVVPRSHAVDPQKAAEFAYRVAMQARKGK